MTRRSRRELEHALDDLSDDAAERAALAGPFRVSLGDEESPDRAPDVEADGAAIYFETDTEDAEDTER